MKSNLIQAYINNHPQINKPKNDNVVKDFDVNKELLNRTFIKPLPSNGKLVKSGLFDIPSEFAKDIRYDWNAFWNATKGKANDHELGKLNDVGMKLGGLSIASYLMTRKQTPMTKLFEFIGLGTFLASMEIWPKLFIQLPAYLIHGVNVRQEYRDSFGRKKMFYQDHQFIPWDLYSDKQIDKIGDRLNVPKNIPNRREYIQEKMRKIALQNNTLWMLTSGFATPLLSALLCNQLEKPVSNYLDKRNIAKADALLTNFPQEIEKLKYEESVKKLETLLSENRGKSISPELFKEIADCLSEGLDGVTEANLRRDLVNITPNMGTYSVTEANAENLNSILRAHFAKYGITPEQLEQIVPDKATIVQKFTEKNIMRDGFEEFSEHSKVIQDLLDANIERFKAENPTLAEDIDFAMDNLLHPKNRRKGSVFARTMKKQSSAVLDDGLIDLYKTIGATLRKFRAGVSVLDRYAYIKVAQAPETVLGNAWNEVADTLMNALHFTNDEIRLSRIDRTIAGKFLRDKIEGISADSKKYSEFIDTMVRALSNLDSKFSSANTIENSLGHIDMETNTNRYVNLTNTTYKEAADALYSRGLSRTAQGMVGFADTSKTSARDLQLSYVLDRVKGVKNSFYRFLNLADLYRRISTLENVGGELKADVCREVKEEMVELAKTVMLEGHSSDYAVKFFQRRNPTPDTSDLSQIETQLGKVVNKYFGKHPTNQTREIFSDSGFFKSVMELMYGEQIHSDTKSLMERAGFYQEFLDYRNSVIDYLGGDKYFVLPNHIARRETAMSSEQKFLLTGCAPDEIFHKAFSQKFNSNKWFGVFGKMAVGLIGVTLLAQFFFGRTTPAKELNKNDK